MLSFSFVRSCIAKMRNVEIKAKVKNLDDIISRAKNLSDTEVEVIKQVDTFYKIPSGRLKLRKFEDNSSELIYYERDDKEGPKLSTYNKASLPPNATDDLNTVILNALGEKGIVKKTRRLYMVGQTRIHIDSVENLGDFMELEVALKPEETVEDGTKIAHSLMEQLGVDKSELLAGAYRDLLEEKK